MSGYPALVLIINVCLDTLLVSGHSAGVWIPACVWIDSLCVNTQLVSANKVRVWIPSLLLEIKLRLRYSFSVRINSLHVYGTSFSRSAVMFEH